MEKLKQTFTIIDVENQFLDGQYVLHEDSCLMCSNLLYGNFQLLLGEGYHKSIGLDSGTGECLSVYALLDAIDFEKATIILPASQKGGLFFKCDSLKTQDGDHYIPFAENAYFDENQLILAFGDVTTSNGQVIEFANDTYAKINDGCLLCIYVRVPPNAIERIKTRKTKLKKWLNIFNK